MSATFPRWVTRRDIYADVYSVVLGMLRRGLAAGHIRSCMAPQAEAHPAAAAAVEDALLRRAPKPKGGRP